MDIEKQIEWLIKQVNALRDKECWCNDCTSTSNIITPNLKFSYGKGTKHGTRNGTIKIKDGEVGNDVITDVYRLGLIVENYDLIKDYNPVLIIDRYRGKEYKGLSNTGANMNRNSGFRHEGKIESALNDRPNEIPINEKEFILDFKQEHYFRTLGDANSVYTSGIGYNRSNRDLERRGPRVHLAFRVRLTINGKTFDTDILRYLTLEYKNKSIRYVWNQ